MSGIVELLRSRRVPQVAVLTLMSVGFAGCSGDMSTRFSQNSYSNNPFAFEPQATGSVAAAPPPQVERRERPGPGVLFAAAGPAEARDHRHGPASFGRDRP